LTKEKTVLKKNNTEL